MFAFEIIGQTLKLRMMNNTKTTDYVLCLWSFPKVLYNMSYKCKRRGCNVLSIYLINILKCKTSVILKRFVPLFKKKKNWERNTLN